LTFDLTFSLAFDLAFDRLTAFALADFFRVGAPLFVAFFFPDDFRAFLELFGLFEVLALATAAVPRFD
jgi:hypothetical protein